MLPVSTHCISTLTIVAFISSTIVLPSIVVLLCSQGSIRTSLTRGLPFSIEFRRDMRTDLCFSTPKI